MNSKRELKVLPSFFKVKYEHFLKHNVYQMVEVMSHSLKFESNQSHLMKDGV
jgi:hypothetical protein